jgi:hypothetical protein
VACLSSQQADVIRQYVRQGGALLATQETSLFDETGKARGDFALADLFGAHWQRSPTEATDLFLNFEAGRSPQLYAAGTRVPQDPDAVVIVADDPRQVLANTVFEARRQTISPGLIVRPFGRGRVAYVSGSLEAVYYQSRIASVGDPIARVVEYLTDAAWPYRLRAPAGVIAHLAASPKGLLLHVLCNVGDKWDGPVSRQNYLTVSGISAEVRLPPSRKLAGVRLLGEGKRCDYRRQEDYVCVDLPPVKIYEGLYIELQ